MPEPAPGTFEERFDRLRRTLTLFVGPIAFLTLLILPPAGLEPAAQRLAAVLVLVIVYWVGEPIPLPVTALLGPVLCVVLRVGSMGDVFAPFASPIIFLFIGSFLLARSMSVHGLDRRIALKVLSLRRIGGRTGRLMVGLGLVPLCLSMWISDSATTAMICPVALGVLSSVGAAARAEGRALPLKWEQGTLLLVAYASLIGGIGTPIGTPPNLIALGMLERLSGASIDFLSWMLLTIPIAALVFAAAALLFRLLHPAGVECVAGAAAFVAMERAALGPLSRGQLNTAAAFGTAAFLWVLPAVAAILLGQDHFLAQELEARLPEGGVALLAAGVLFLLPVDWKARKFTLDWEDGVKIDWGTILLFGGGLSLGSLMFTTGMADALGEGIVRRLGALSVWSLTALALFLAKVITEFTSNTATANMLVPMVLALAESAGVSPVPPAVAVALGASMAFMLPVSTPSNAIVYGTGKVPITAMIRAGILLDVVSYLLIFAGLRLLMPLLGYL